MSHTDEEIIEAYYKYQITKSDDDFWVWEEVDKLCQSLESGLCITQKLIESAPSEFSMRCIAAGHLEDLVYRFPANAVQAIAAAAEESERMKRALLSVNVDDESPAIPSWNELLIKHHGKDVSGRIHR